MRIVIFCHSLVSDWNHGNAHFLRGLSTELLARGHDLEVYEPRGGWSAENLRSEYGREALLSFQVAYPHLSSTEYDLSTLNLDRELQDTDLVLVHEWNDPELVRRLGDHRRRSSGYCLLFHDTHHRCVTAPEELSRYPLDHYDGVLAFGASVADVYRKRGWGRNVWVWHEAADVRVFKPLPRTEDAGDLVWIGNWGDDERKAELREFLIEPVRDLKLRARIHGVRYPDAALALLREAGIECSGWIANHCVPELFANFRFTVHVPRRPYACALRGVPTIRVFEALACGIPLLSASWDDCEGLFTPGEDFLLVSNGDEMSRAMATVLADSGYAASLAEHGRQTVLRRHTCAHRVDELMSICKELGVGEPAIAAGN